VDVAGVALVTGASRGIGRAVALELATRGFEVVATMRDLRAGARLPDEAGATGGTLRVDTLDVTCPETIAIPSGLRVLVNNAGLEHENLPLEETPLEWWRDMFEVNVFGLVEVTRRAIPVLRASGGGVVCNISSSSILAPVPFYATYRASKAAVSAISESLRAELAPQGIRVVEIMPGPIDTDMLRYSQASRITPATDVYRPLAEHMNANKTNSVASLVYPVADAANLIVDAIVADDGPMRYGCDPLSSGMLEGWRNASDEEFMTGMLKSLGG
jgi:NAD(P)-dependent dehydrogenase (short-subunit alcohol dehydrogenase family)